MSSNTISVPAAQAVIRYSEDTIEKLNTELVRLDSEVNSKFAGLTDPTIAKYNELSENMRNTLMQICAKMQEVSDYCKEVIRWVGDYTGF